MKHIFIGIDPGISGAIAALGENSDVLYVADTPTVHSLKSALDNIVSQIDYTPVAAIERVTAFPGQGVVSMFNFGFAAGAAHACLVCNAVPFVTVQPKTWQAGVIPKTKEQMQRKSISIDIAKERYKNAAEYLTRKKDHGRADAMHLAAYARKYYTLL